MTQAPCMRQVKASAGSGKTHDITGKFLAYLSGLSLDAHRPSCALKSSAAQGNWADILAITFTNAAATEMKERVISRLKGIALGNARAEDMELGITSEQAKAWISTILRQYGSLNIRTIDSLLHRIVRTAALDLDLPPDFEISFATDETLEPIFDALIERAYQDDGEIAMMLEAICLSLLYREKSTGFATGRRILDATRPLLEKALSGNLSSTSARKDIEKKYNALRDDLVNTSSRMVELVDTEELPLKKNVYEVFEACTKADRKKADSAYVKKSCLTEVIPKKNQDDASQKAKDVYISLTKAAHAYVNDGHILQRALEWEPFVEFTKLIAAEVKLFQQKEHKVPAVTMPLLARQILNFEYGGVPQALCRLGSRMHHILLDEFQDTSHEQWEALRPLAVEALSNGGSLTWVGDIKQAIYGWRGGDSDLFDGVGNEQELTCMTGEPKKDNLPTNWRSLKNIVETNNKIFLPLGKENVAKPVLRAMLAKEFPEHLLDEGAKKLHAAFADVEQKVSDKNNFGGLVSIIDVEAEKTEELTEAVKEKLQPLMQDLIGRRKFSDITILTRNNSGAARVAEWLMEWDIPVITENSLLLNAHPRIQESLAILNFLNTSHDDLSFWTVLTGSIFAPYLGKPNYSPTLEELHAWALNIKTSSKTLDNNSSNALSFEFQKQWPEFWEDVFAPFYNTAQLITPYDTMQEWYRILRVFEHFPKDAIFLRRFLEIIHSAGERGSATLSTFLEYWLKHGTDEKAPMPTNINAVQIMTIHKSKGLQFKVVIIPWTSFNQKENHLPPVTHEVQGLNVIAPRCTQMGDVYYKAQMDAALESLNTLYVACTRAEEELHIFNTHTPYMLRMRRNLACGLLELLPWAELELPVQIGTAKDDSKQALTAELLENIELNDSHMEAQAISLLRPMEWLPRLKIFRNPLQELILTPRLRGLLTHHCLEQFQSTGHAQQDAVRAVELGLRTFALPITKSDALRDELITALSWYAKLPEVWTVQGLAEQSIMDAEGNVLRVDLLLPPQGKHGWRVIDFKTGQVDPKHLEQMRNYMKLLDDLPNEMSGANVPCSEGVLIYLDLQNCRMVYADSASELLPAPTWQGGNA